MKMKNYEIKAIDDGSGVNFEGYLSTYGNTDRDGDVFETGAFSDSVKSKSTAPLCYNHDRNSVIGKLDLSEDGRGLYVKGSLNMTDEKAKNIYELMKMGALDSMSVGFSVDSYEPVDVQRPFGGWKIKKATVYEGSIVTVPANDQAVITAVKLLEDDTDGKFFELLKKAVKEVITEADDVKAKRAEIIKAIDKVNSERG